MSYDLKNLPLHTLIGPVAEATSALTRLDERLDRSDLKNGWIERMHYHDACASLWIDGELVQLQDLVLHDATRNIQPPTHALTTAAEVLRTRRRIMKQSPGWSLSTNGLQVLRHGNQDHFSETSDHNSAPPPIHADDTSNAFMSEMKDIDAILAHTQSLLEHASTLKSGLRPARKAFVYDKDWDEDTQFSDWQKISLKTSDLPPVLRAALMLDAWNQMQILQHTRWLGRSLVEDFLREQISKSHLMALNVGLKTIPIKKRTSHSRLQRLLAILYGITASANEGMKLHDKLSLSKQQLQHKISDCRQSSHLPELIELVLAKPMVSTEMIATSLAITPRSSLRLVNQLSLREITGRGRFRAWSIM